MAPFRMSLGTVLTHIETEHKMVLLLAEYDTNVCVALVPILTFEGNAVKMEMENFQLTFPAVDAITWVSLFSGQEKNPRSEDQWKAASSLHHLNKLFRRDLSTKLKILYKLSRL